MTNQKPIRKDRVLLVGVILLGIIFLPILIRSCGSAPAPTSPTQTPVTETPAPPVEEPATTVPPIEESPVVTEPPVEEPAPQEEPSIITHTVVEGETLNGIASLLGVSVAQIMADNRLLSPAIVPGETLRVARDGILHLIKEGQTLTDISKTYGVPIDRITEANGIADPERIIAGEEIIIPGATPALWETVVRLSHGRKARFIWPLEGEVVSEFGWRIHPVLGTRHHHNGIDIDVPTGTLVHAAASGKVFFVGEQEGYGMTVILRHADDYYTIYGHLSKTLVYVGQYVEAGQEIAESGNTGISSGPHLHFEVRNREFPVDPRRYLP